MNRLTQLPIVLLFAAILCTAMVGIGVFGRRAKSGSRSARIVPIVAGVLGLLVVAYVAPDYLRLGGGGWVLIAVVISSFLGSVVGAILAVRGWRGQRVGDHPHCRECGFDLFGRAEGTSVCVECGTFVTDQKSIEIGVRRRRLGLFVSGTALLLAILGTWARLGSTVIENYRARGVAYYMPLSRLARDYGRSPGGELATLEVDRRLTNGEFDHADFESFAEWVLEDSDPSADHPRRYVYTKLAFAGWARGQLSESTMRRLVRKAAEFRVRAPAFVKADDVLIDPWCLLNDFVLRPVNLSLAVEYRDGQLLVGDRRLPWEYRRLSNEGFSHSTRITPTYTRAILPEWAMPSSAVETLVTWKAKATVKITGPMCVPIEEEVDATAAAMTMIVSDEQFVRPDTSGRHPPFEASADVNVREELTGRYSVRVAIRTRVDLAFIGDLYIRKGEEETLLGPVQFAFGGNETRFDEQDTFPEGPFSLVLKPVPSRGMDGLDRTPTYQRTIVIESPTVTGILRPK